MRKLNYLLLLVCMLPAFVMVGCSNDDKEEKQVVLPDESEQTQQAYATDNSTGGFTFTAKSAWTATVKEGTNTRAESNVKWLRLFLDGVEAYNGAAGTFTLVIELDANYTGHTRTATIEIVSGKDKITITVTQEGKTEEGKVPEKPLMVVNITESASHNSDYYSQENNRVYKPFYYEFKYDHSDRLKEYHIRRKNDAEYRNVTTLSYDIQGEIRLKSNWDDEDDLDIAYLDKAGRVTRLINKYSEGEGRVSIEYNADGYFTKALTNVVEEEEIEPGIFDIDWVHGNMVSYKFNGELDGEATFAPQLNNKVNIDLNAFFFGFLDSDELFEYANDEEENILAMIDKFGKRSQNYMINRRVNMWDDNIEYPVDMGIDTERSEPQIGTIMSTRYNREWYGNGAYTFDTKGAPTTFTRKVKVNKTHTVYKGRKTYVKPSSEAEKEAWLDQYGEGPYFRIHWDDEDVSTLYDTYTYQINYAE